MRPNDRLLLRLCSTHISISLLLHISFRFELLTFFFIYIYFLFKVISAVVAQTYRRTGRTYNQSLSLSVVWGFFVGSPSFVKLEQFPAFFFFFVNFNGGNENVRFFCFEGCKTDYSWILRCVERVVCFTFISFRYTSWS